MTTADEMRQLADALERGAAADIWADFAAWRNYAAPEETERGLAAVDQAQSAMTRAAALLRQFANPASAITDPTQTAFRGMLP